MRQTVKNRMIKNVQMMAVGMMATASIMGTAAAMGVKMDNIPFNVLANPFQAVMTQGVAAIKLGSSGSCGDNATYELSMDGTLTISGTGEINSFLLHNDTNIKKVIINEGITEIGNDTFKWCSNLENVTLPNSIKTIGSYAFEQCTKLKQINLPNGLNYIGNRAFDRCQSIENIVIPDTVSTIEHTAFAQCQNLQQIKLPQNIDKLEGSVFEGCQSLTSIELPDSLEVIDSQVFEGCQSLRQIEIPESVSMIGNQAFRDCQSLTNINIPERITSIEGSTFSDCTQLTEIKLPDELNSIGSQAFSNCQSLTQIYIPSGVERINEFAFYKCDKLTLIQGMEGVTNIWPKQFYATGVGTYHDPLETTLETTNEYVLNYNWLGNENRIIKAPETPECGPDATYEEDDGKLTITGSGSIDDEAFKDKDTVTEVVIEEGITEIGNQSFENMDNLETVIIPDSVTNIGDQAFAEDPKLEIVQGGDNADIADNAFDCTEPETTIKTDNENIYNNIKDNTDRDVQLQNSVPISPVEENWLYSSDDEAFITDKVQVGSVKDDFESLLDEFATVVGLDEKQGAKQNYETADASDEDTLVYCTKASDWIITIPKDLVMSGDDESRAEYVVGIYGNVDPAKRVTVTPAPSFEMTNTGNAGVKYNAQVNQTVTGINGMDIIESPEADVDDASQMSGTITANLKRAGSYRGTMTFTVDYVDHT